MGLEIEMRECEECKVIYQPSRTGQKFCCKKCSSRQYMRAKSNEKKAVKKKKPEKIPEKFLVRGKISYSNRSASLSHSVVS